MSKNMKEEVLALFRASKGYPTYAPGATITVTAQAIRYGGNRHPHFSVTGEVTTPASRRKRDSDMCGCIHDHILRFWPELAPLIALHGSNADDGEPTHGEANGFYDLAGAVEGNFNEQYHLGNSKMHLPKDPVTGIPLPYSKEFSLGNIVTIVQPHPFCITDKHFPRDGGGCIKPEQAPCGVKGCGLKYADHIPEKVLQIVLSKKADDLNAVEGLKEYLDTIKSAAEAQGIAGFIFPTVAQVKNSEPETEYRLPTHDECLSMLAKHMRCPLSECVVIRDKCIAAFKAGSDAVATSEVVSHVTEQARREAGNIAARKVFGEFVDAQRTRWTEEAKAGLAMIRQLAADQRARQDAAVNQQTAS